ncbi:MAG: hypothetical protein K6B41_14665 [Butyrivibrio sp.]|nr:hypothetical protein [Butyrivibrio sp.]
MGNLKYEIIDNLSTIKTQYDEIQVNYMKWGNNPPKYDIRKWSFEGEPLKGFTLSKEEMLELYADLKYQLNHPEAELPEKQLFSSDNEVKEKLIDFRKFVIHDDMSDCESNDHDYEEIKASIYVYSSACGMQQYTVNAYYCNECKAYYINEAEYNILRRRGKLMCQVFTSDSFEKFKSESNYGANLRPESLLHIAGYNVGQEDNLSEDVRHKIIEYVIESGLMKKSEVLYLLNCFIETRELMQSMEVPVSRWKADREWLRGYKSTGKRLVGIRYIVDER